MVQLLLSLVLVGGVAVSFAQLSVRDGGDRPSIYEKLKDNEKIASLLVSEPALKDLLMDRDFSDRVYVITDGIETIIKNGPECAFEIVKKAIADLTSEVGKVAQKVDFNSVTKPNLLTIATVMTQFSEAIKEIQADQMKPVLQQLIQKIFNDCGEKDLANFKSDLDYIWQKIDEALKKT